MARLATLYAQDEDLAVRAAGDFGALCPPWQKLAEAVDGVISGWVLSSPSVDFADAGVAAGHVVWLKKPTSSTIGQGFPGQGEFVAVESVTSDSVTLRRVGRPASEGAQPAQVPAVTFQILTLTPQIEEASFELNRRLMIDPAVTGRTPSDLRDLRDLRQACVLTVLRWRYAAEMRDGQGDFALKFRMLSDELTMVLDRLHVRWNPTGDAQPTTSMFSTRLVR